MRVFAAVACLMFICLPTAALARKESAPFHVVGVATSSCGLFLQSRAKHLDPNQADVYNQWIDGFISGVNYESNDAIPADHAGIEAWVAKYCADHPLDSLAAAALQLVRENRRGPP